MVTSVPWQLESTVAKNLDRLDRSLARSRRAAPGSGSTPRRPERHAGAGRLGGGARGHAAASAGPPTRRMTGRDGTPATGLTTTSSRVAGSS